MKCAASAFTIGTWPKIAFEPGEAGLHPARLGGLDLWLSADRTTLKRINRLINDALRDPAGGIGKPEPLRHLPSGSWSRRISDEHRLVYLVDGGDLVMLQARFHYK